LPSRKAEQFHLWHFFEYLRNQGDLERTESIKSLRKQERIQRWGFRGRNPLPFEAKAMVLMGKIIRQLSSGNIHSNQ